MSIVRQGILPVGSLDHAITLQVQESGGSHFEPVIDTTPYLYRTSPQDVANMMKLKKVVGGTVAWNQLVRNGNFESTTYWNKSNGSISANNNELTYTLTTVGTYGYENQIQQPFVEYLVSEHKYLLTFDCYGGKALTLTWWLIGNSIGGTNTAFQLAYSTPNAWGSIATVVSASSAKSSMQLAYNATMNSLAVGDTIKVRNVMAIDLTQMFGSTIADYIYSLEQAQAGDGVAFFKALFGEDYYPYNSGELLSVKTSARKTYNADNVEIGSYALDSDLELRGIPKLDADHNLYYDGDEYEPSGTVTRKYGVRAYQGGDSTDGSTMVTDGTNTVYKLVTPTTESADEYTQSQRVGATEEFVDGRTVEMPVGNESEYKRLIQGE